MQCSEEACEFIGSFCFLRPPVAQQRCFIQSCNASVTVRSLIHIFSLIWYSHNHSFSGKVVMLCVESDHWLLIVFLFVCVFVLLLHSSFHFNKNHHDWLNQACTSNFGTSPCGLLVDFCAHLLLEEFQGRIPVHVNHYIVNSNSIVSILLSLFIKSSPSTPTGPSRHTNNLTMALVLFNCPSKSWQCDSTPIVHSCAFLLQHVVEWKATVTIWMPLLHPGSILIVFSRVY